MTIHILHLIIRRLFKIDIRSRFNRWRTRRLLAELDKHQLRDIGLSRDDVASWSERLRDRIAKGSETLGSSAARRKAAALADPGQACRRALAGLDEAQQSKLSDAGLRAWREARREGLRRKGPASQ